MFSWFICHCILTGLIKVCNKPKLTGRYRFLVTMLSGVLMHIALYTYLSRISSSCWARGFASYYLVIIAFDALAALIIMAEEGNAIMEGLRDAAESESADAYLSAAIESVNKDVKTLREALNG